MDPKLMESIRKMTDSSRLVKGDRLGGVGLVQNHRVHKASIDLRFASLLEATKNASHHREVVATTFLISVMFMK